MGRVNRKPQETDVLLLHGMSDQLVQYVKDLCGSLKLSAATVQELPSRGLTQNKRVKHYIGACQTCIVIATFDEEEPNSSKARSNVYDELRYCHETKPDDTIVLREKRNKRLVSIPSNLQGELVTIEFNVSGLHEFAPRFIKELHSRIPEERPIYKEHSAGRQLKVFFDKMDRLWENEFDKAWEKIHRQDYLAEREFANLLDQFFQCYHAGISALVRRRRSPAILAEVFRDAHVRALDLAVRAWGIIADGKMRLADKAINDTPHHPSKRERELHDRANTEFRRGKGSSKTPSEAINHFKTAIDLLDRSLHPTRG